MFHIEIFLGPDCFFVSKSALRGASETKALLGSNRFPFTVIIYSYKTHELKLSSAVWIMVCRNILIQKNEKKYFNTSRFCRTHPNWSKLLSNVLVDKIKTF